MRSCFAAVTANPVRIPGLDGYGIAPGCRADFVLLVRFGCRGVEADTGIAARR